MRENVPEHVAPSLVYDFDIWNMSPECSSPLHHWNTLREHDAPRIFYTPRNGGHWVLHHFEDTLEGYRDTAFFTNYPNGIPARAGGAAKLIPVEIDPPAHQKYRRVLAPAFSPVALQRLQPRIRERLSQLIEPLVSQGHCDFMAAVAGRLPTGIFIELMGLPLDEFPLIMQMEHRFLQGPDEAARQAGADAILQYIVHFIEQEARHPRDNLAGLLLMARDEAGQPWTREEIYNTAFLLYVAGLDTVTNMMGYIWWRLAREPAARAHLRGSLDKLDGLVDELMRVSVPAVNARRVRHDGTWRGVFMRSGDAVLCAPMAANRDPVAFPDPETLNWNRPNSRQHVSFGAGPHRCVGSHLARQEIICALEKWFRLIPEFELEPGGKLNPHLGNITGLGSLPLVWGARH